MMIACLRKHLLYTEKRARDVIFQATESVMSEATGTHRTIVLSRLTREIARMAGTCAAETGFAIPNWNLATQATLKAMVNAGAFLRSDGSPVVSSIETQATAIAAVKAGFRDLTEAYLLRFLISQLGDVNTRDHRVLAYVLFRQFDPSVPMDDLEDRVAVLLATLGDSVVLREDGTYAPSVSGACVS